MNTAAPRTAAQTGLQGALLQRVRGIGPERAQRVLAAFGEGLDAALSNMNNVEAVAAAVAPDRPALARRLAAVLMAKWTDELRPEHEAVAWLDRHGITDQPGLARRIVRVLGPRTGELLVSNPYILAKTLPWPRMDQIGRRALGLRLGADGARDAPQRLLGAVDSAVGEWMTAGHTAIGKDRLTRLLATRIGREWHGLALAEHLGEKHGRLVDAGAVWRFAGCAFLEREVMARIEAMPSERGRIVVTPEAADRAIDQIMPLLPKPLSDEQRAAVRHALLNPFAVIGGGAGTGKTATMQALVLAWEALGGAVHPCALAGKAALRLSQATHRLAKTIHRTLSELAARRAAEEDGKRPNGDWAQFDDRTMVIVDESSMPDLGQWARLLKAMPPGCRLVMVGDTAQLPPIGFGLVFHLLAQRPDTAMLTRIFRQDDASDIPMVADAIRHRMPLGLDAFNGPADGVSLLDCKLTDLDREVARAVTSLGGFGADGLALHVVAATNQRVAALNLRFHDFRRQGKDEVKGYLGALFSVGDPVVHLENDYKRGLFNGMLGTVTAVDIWRRSVEVSFEGATHVFARDDLIKLDLAYALTCHKLQGSQAVRVVIAIEPSRLLEPSWLYTSLTRAEQQAVVVGPKAVLTQALRREFAWKDRCIGMAMAA
ncbi:MAG: AAA family ATPase [Desulfovibrio sp.]|uniref:AAA family ATPase n=1 Tax=Desulfovibrio sp. TaxID=885 RepID=UPI00135E045A|nr:AAA family ATPase [Desulfovibrio sp.]MTJ93599.1 AAA family ATPase [Desulfovibrio sp.]